MTTKCSFRSSVISSGSTTAMLYQMLKALPRSCGTTGANTVAMSARRTCLTAASMVEKGEADECDLSMVQSCEVRRGSRFRRGIRTVDLQDERSRPGDLESQIAAADLQRARIDRPRVGGRQSEDREIHSPQRSRRLVIAGTAGVDEYAFPAEFDQES